MPLDDNKVTRIKVNLRRMKQNRTLPVTLYFRDGATLTVEALWKVPELDDPELPPVAKDVDAMMMVLLEDVTLAQLEAAVYVIPSSFEGANTAGFSSRYLIDDVQPKGTAWPPNRAFVYLNRAE